MDSSPQLHQVAKHEAAWAHLKYRFLSVGWQNSNKPKPKIRFIFRIVYSDRFLYPYRWYRDTIDTMTKERFLCCGNAKLRFHGTVYRCSIGDSPDQDTLCHDHLCPLCSILQGSFSLSKSGDRNKFQRFGHGIYTTKSSSKADDYVQDSSSGRETRVMIVARVALGNPLRLEWNTEQFQEPPFGFHSVMGVPGPVLNYEENVVYSEHAIRPAFLIVYDKPPDTQTSADDSNLSYRNGWDQGSLS